MTDKEIEFMSRVSAIMIEQMQKLNYSNVDVANMIGVNKSTVGDWIHKSTMIKSNLIKPLCNALQITPDYLLGFTDDKKSTVSLQLLDAIMKHPEDYNSLSKILDINLSELLKDLK